MWTGDQLFYTTIAEHDIPKLREETVLNLFIMQNCKARSFTQFVVGSLDKSMMGNLISYVTPTT